MMTLAGIPTTVMPDNWPDYDLIAAERDGHLQRINVKSLRQVATKPGVVLKPGDWDWFAFVSLTEEYQHPRYWLIPKEIALQDKEPGEKGKWRVTMAKLEGPLLKRFEDKSTLRTMPENKRSLEEMREARLSSSPPELWIDGKKVYDRYAEARLNGNRHRT